MVCSKLPLIDGTAQNHFIHLVFPHRRLELIEGPRTGTPMIHRCVFIGSSSMKTTGFISQSGFARISLTIS
jgi:hypothetical protein